jgi:hypothetical protein
VEKRIGRGKGRREEEEIREKIIEVGKGREGKEEMEVGKILREERGMYEGLELTKREKREGGGKGEGKIRREERGMYKGLERRAKWEMKERERWEREEGKIKREERGMYEGLELTKREKKERVGEREKGKEEDKSEECVRDCNARVGKGR